MLAIIFRYPEPLLYYSFVCLQELLLPVAAEALADIQKSVAAEGGCKKLARGTI
jgi:hypothetical protein